MTIISFEMCILSRSRCIQNSNRRRVTAIPMHSCPYYDVECNFSHCYRFNHNVRSPRHSEINNFVKDRQWARSVRNLAPEISPRQSKLMETELGSELRSRLPICTPVENPMSAESSGILLLKRAPTRRPSRLIPTLLIYIQRGYGKLVQQTGTVFQSETRSRPCLDSNITLFLRFRKQYCASSCEDQLLGLP